MCDFSFPYVVQRDCWIRRAEADLLLCAVTGRDFEPVGLMKRDLDVNARSSASTVYLTTRILSRSTSLLRVVAAASALFVRFALPTEHGHR